MSKEFTMVTYSCSAGRQTYILGGIEDFLSSLEDALTTLATIRSSKYVDPIKVCIAAEFSIKIEDAFSFVGLYLCLACSTRLGESFIYADGSGGNMDGLSEELDVPRRNICFNGSAKVGI